MARCAITDPTRASSQGTRCLRDGAGKLKPARKGAGSIYQTRPGAGPGSEIAENAGPGGSIMPLSCPFLPCVATLGVCALALLPPAVPAADAPRVRALRTQRV